MTWESRTRIIVLVPFPRTYTQFLIAEKVISDLMQLCGGVTYSDQYSPVFEGRWYNPRTSRTVSDPHVLVWGDARIRIFDPALEYYLSRLKRQLQHDFNQELAWITAHEILRLTTHDP